jgi:SHAQKYF class myb-like DNA-binding protein
MNETFKKFVCKKTVRDNKITEDPSSLKTDNKGDKVTCTNMEHPRWGQPENQNFKKLALANSSVTSFTIIPNVSCQSFSICHGSNLRINNENNVKVDDVDPDKTLTDYDDDFVQGNDKDKDEDVLKGFSSNIILDTAPLFGPNDSFSLNPIVDEANSFDKDAAGSLDGKEGNAVDRDAEIAKETEVLKYNLNSSSFNSGKAVINSSGSFPVAFLDVVNACEGLGGDNVSKGIDAGNTNDVEAAFASNFKAGSDADFEGSSYSVFKSYGAANVTAGISEGISAGVDSNPKKDNSNDISPDQDEDILSNLSKLSDELFSNNGDDGANLNKSYSSFNNYPNNNPSVTFHKESYNNGRWQPEEHDKFIQAMYLYGNEWRKVQEYIGSRSSTQARSHAQKFFIRLRKKFDIDNIHDEEDVYKKSEEIIEWIKSMIPKEVAIRRSSSNNEPNESKFIKVIVGLLNGQAETQSRTNRKKSKTSRDNEEMLKDALRKKESEKSNRENEEIDNSIDNRVSKGNENEDENEKEKEENLSNNMSKNISKNLSKNISKYLSKNLSNNSSKNISKNNFDNFSQNFPNFPNLPNNNIPIDLKPTPTSTSSQKIKIPLDDTDIYELQSLCSLNLKRRRSEGLSLLSSGSPIFKIMKEEKSLMSNRHNRRKNSTEKEKNKNNLASSDISQVSSDSYKDMEFNNNNKEDSTRFFNNSYNNKEKSKNKNINERNSISPTNMIKQQFYNPGHKHYINIVNINIDGNNNSQINMTTDIGRNTTRENKTNNIPSNINTNTQSSSTNENVNINSKNVSNTNSNINLNNTLFNSLNDLKKNNSQNPTMSMPMSIPMAMSMKPMYNIKPLNSNNPSNNSGSNTGNNISKNTPNNAIFDPELMKNLFLQEKLNFLFKNPNLPQNLSNLINNLQVNNLQSSNANKPNNQLNTNSVTYTNTQDTMTSLNTNNNTSNNTNINTNTNTNITNFSNQYANQYTNQQTNQYANQYANQQTNQYPNQQINQYPNHYPNQYPNQQTNQQTNQYTNQQTNQYNNQQTNQFATYYPNPSNPYNINIFDNESRKDQMIFDTDQDEESIFKVSSKGSKDEGRSFNSNLGFDFNRDRESERERKEDTYLNEKMDFDLDQFFKSSE